MNWFRRSSMSLSSAPGVKVAAKTRRQTMMPTLIEAKTSSKGAKAESSKHLMAVSPTKKFSKSTKNILNDEDILSKLDTSDPKPRTSRRSSTSKVVKAPPVTKSKLPVQSPPPGSKPTVRRSRRVSGDPLSLKSVGTKTVTKTRRQTMLPAVAEVKSPAKTPKSPVDVIKDVKKVEIRLKQLKLKEDPNLIFSMLEDSPDKKERISAVVEQIIKNKMVESPVTRQKENKKVKEEKKSPKKAAKTPKRRSSKASLQVVDTPDTETKTPRRTSRSSLSVVKTPEPKIQIKAEKLTPLPETKPKLEEPKSAQSTKKRKETPTATSASFQNKRQKLDKTPESVSKVTKKQKTPSREVDKYKQRSPAPGSLR